LAASASSTEAAALDRDIDRSNFDAPVMTPHPAKQLVSIEGALRMANQELEQPRFHSAQ
jgi:hypothetical protein